MGVQRRGGVLANALRRPPNTANTSVLVLDTLETVGTTSLGGALKGLLGAYSAHYCEDPVSGSVVNFGFDPYLPRVDLGWVRAGSRRSERLRRLREQVAEVWPRMRLRLYETDRPGVTRYLRAVTLPAMCFVHDMARTQRYVVFAATPLRFDPLPILAGTSAMAEALHFARDVPAYLLTDRWPRHGCPSTSPSASTGPSPPAWRCRRCSRLSGRLSGSSARSWRGGGR